MQATDSGDPSILLEGRLFSTPASSPFSPMRSQLRSTEALRLMGVPICVKISSLWFVNGVWMRSRIGSGGCRVPVGILKVGEDGGVSSLHVALRSRVLNTW
ncbi:hypothetical protein F2Q69_00014973 [Brassica cretica]|uniref:Uncharacterized protein n=2 Tax=Brassica cretica TaxID=69181 RepID=A0ABQ7DJ89_BRACR|nr:hypothetical protein F2Q69_00014973 [Brassica cretica]KAF3577647.1 hypothetical protein DY000_02032474 [Brassica cretica]